MIDDDDDAGGGDDGDDGNGLLINLLPAALPQAVNPPAPDWPTSQRFSRLKSFLLQAILFIIALVSAFKPLHVSPPLCEDFQAWNLFQQSTDRVTNQRYATTSPIEMLLPSYRGFSNTFKRSWHCLSTHSRSVQFPWQPTLELPSCTFYKVKPTEN